MFFSRTQFNLLQGESERIHLYHQRIMFFDDKRKASTQESQWILHSNVDARPNTGKEKAVFKNKT